MDLMIRAAAVLGVNPVNFLLFPAPRKPVQQRQAGQAWLPEIQPVVTIGTWIINLATRRHSWSRHLCRMLGHSGRGACGPRAFEKYLDPADVPDFKVYWDKVQNRIISQHLTCKIIRRDCIARMASIQADLIGNEDDAPDMAWLSVVDATEWGEFARRAGSGLVFQHVHGTY